MPRRLTKVALQTFDGLIVRVSRACTSRACTSRVEDEPEHPLTGRRGAGSGLPPPPWRVDVICVYFEEPVHHAADGIVQKRLPGGVKYGVCVKPYKIQGVAECPS